MALNRFNIPSNKIESTEPKRKRQRREPILPCKALAQLSWKAQDQLPLLSSRKSEWNQALKGASETQWFLKCQEWADTLLNGHFCKIRNVSFSNSDCGGIFLMPSSRQSMTTKLSINP